MCCRRSLRIPSASTSLPLHGGSSDAAPVSTRVTVAAAVVVVAVAESVDGASEAMVEPSAKVGGRDLLTTSTECVMLQTQPLLHSNLHHSNHTNQQQCLCVPS